MTNEIMKFEVTVKVNRESFITKEQLLEAVQVLMKDNHIYSGHFQIKIIEIK